MASRVQVNGQVGRKEKKCIREMMGDKVKGAYEHTKIPGITI